MKKTKQIFILLLVGNIFLSGCGKKTISDSSNTLSSSDIHENSGDNFGNNPESSENVPDGEDGTSSNVSPQEFKTPSPTAGVITLEQGYSDSEREVSIVGLKEYKNLKSDKYTDKAEKGKKFLVLFLKVHNRTNDKVYFNVNYLSARVDEKTVENTVLLNEPEGYPTIFSNIVPDSYYGGFIVWEVPKDWKKLEVTYEGWRDSDGLTLNSILTKKDLSEPEEYSMATYDQGNTQ